MPRRPDDRVPGRSADWRPHDTDRSIDPFDDPPRASRPPSSRLPAPPPPRSAPPRPGPSRVARGGLAPRTVLLAGGGVLAVVATVLVFLTDDPDLLRVAVVAAAWAFVLAAFVAGRRSNEESDAAVREAALRRTYEHELEREVAARRQYELELENDLRRESEGAVRAELDALRHELTAVAELRSEVARVADLRHDVAGLSALREEVARVGALRDDVLALTALRSELGQVGELRAELGRLRAELAEQLSSEMLVERIVMRTQASRLTGAESARLEPPPMWRDEPPRGLTGGWPAVRLDEDPGTQQYEQVRIDRSPPPHPWQTVTRAPAAAPLPAPEAPRPTAWAPPPPPTEGYALGSPTPRHSRHAASGDDPEPLPSPREWPSSASSLEGPPTRATGYGLYDGHDDSPHSDGPPHRDPVAARPDERPSPYPRRRSTDDGPATSAPGGPDDLRTTERSAAPAGEAPAGNGRLEQILAEGGVPATGGRRRRRYREEDDAEDDVLARVLRGD